MSADCTTFLRRLEALLGGRPDPAQLTELTWHEHVLTCGSCRELLEHEEALEQLLASLPEPSLPPDLARRVIARLRAGQEAAAAGTTAGAPAGIGAARGDPLDELLDLDDVAVPAGLPGRVRAALEGRRRSLEELLDMVPDEAAPPGLAARVLQSLADARTAAGAAVSGPRSRPGPVLVGGGMAKRVGSLAALFLVVIGMLVVLRIMRRPDGEDGIAEATMVDDEIILAHLPELEYWEALQELDPLEQEIVTRMDVCDEALLDEGS